MLPRATSRFFAKHFQMFGLLKSLEFCKDLNGVWHLGCFSWEVPLALFSTPENHFLALRAAVELPNRKYPYLRLSKFLKNDKDPYSNKKMWKKWLETLLVGAYSCVFPFWTGLNKKFNFIGLYVFLARSLVAFDTLKHICHDHIFSLVLSCTF